MGTQKAGGIDKVMLEKTWANNEARLKLRGEDRALWEASSCTIRPFVYFNKMLIAWTLQQGTPQVREVFKVVGVDVSFQDGVWLRMQAKIANKEVLVNHTPRRLLLGLDIIGWVPFFNEMRFASEDWNDPVAKKSLRMNSCFKTRSSFDLPLVEGSDYISELHVFRNQFPQYRSTYF